MQTNANSALRLSLPAVLSRRLENRSPQLGKTVLMKFAYLLQEVYCIPLGYRFSLYTYGPYSKEVLADLDQAESLGWVHVNMGSDAAGYNITASENSPGPNGFDDHFRQYEHQLSRAIEQFGHFRAKELELRTTAAYFWNLQGTHDDNAVEAVVDAVHDLKPHFTKREIKDAIEELIQNGTIRSAA